MSRMCREKGAVRHDDRLDALAQGVKYFTDILSISAQEEIINRKRQDWNDLLEHWEDDLIALQTTVFNMNMEQRKQARGKDNNSVPTWV